MQSKTCSRKVSTADKKLQALELRKKCLSFQEIADELECSKAYAHKLVSAALKELAAKSEEATGELRELENIRLDSLWSKAYEKAEKGDLAAINICLKISERRAKLYGLDLSKAPVIENTINLEHNETGVVVYIPENNRDKATTGPTGSLPE